MMDNSFAGQTRGFHKSGYFSREEVRLANRNPGIALEMLTHDITPMGMHYQLNHFDIPVIDGDSWSLPVTGLVENPLSLDLGSFKKLSKHDQTVTLECAGNGRAHFTERNQSMPWFSEAVGTAVWSGARLTDVLAQAGMKAGASEVVFIGADRGFDNGTEHHFARSLNMEQAGHPEVLLAYEMNRQPLPVQHGYPLRLIVPGWFGVASVKWLKAVEVIDHAFKGYQQAVNYHYRNHAEDPGVPITEMKVKSLLMPPGIPDWYTRQRIVQSGLVTLTGRAWSGSGAVVEKVEVGIDGAWKTARVGQNLGPYAWRQWFIDWEAEPGEHLLSCRAYDDLGNTQPDDPQWDQAGFGNNALHSLEVTVGQKDSLP